MSTLLRCSGYTVERFGSARAFLARLPVILVTAYETSQTRGHVGGGTGRNQGFVEIAARPQHVAVQSELPQPQPPADVAGVATRILEGANSLRSGQVSPSRPGACLRPFEPSRILMSEARGSEEANSQRLC